MRCHAHSNRFFHYPPRAFRRFMLSGKRAKTVRFPFDGVVVSPHHPDTFRRKCRKIRQKAIIAPHIDFRVGLSAHGPAYYALSDSDADVFVVLATSHYGWGSLFHSYVSALLNSAWCCENHHELLQNSTKSCPTLRKTIRHTVKNILSNLRSFSYSVFDLVIFHCTYSHYLVLSLRCNL